MTVPAAPRRITVNQRIADWKTAFDAVHEVLRADDHFNRLKLMSGTDQEKIESGRMVANMNTRPVAAQIAADIIKGVNA